MLGVDEIEPELRNMLERLEGDFITEDVVKAYNNIAKAEGWEKRITIK